MSVSTKAGDMYAMRPLIDDYEHGNVQRSCMWLYLAEKLGNDLIESHTYAINEGGGAAPADYSGTDLSRWQ